MSYFYSHVGLICVMVCFACKDSKFPNIIYIGVRKNKEFVTSRKVFREKVKNFPLFSLYAEAQRHKAETNTYKLSTNLSTLINCESLEEFPRIACNIVFNEPPLMGGGGRGPKRNPQAQGPWIPSLMKKLKTL